MALYAQHYENGKIIDYWGFRVRSTTTRETLGICWGKDETEALSKARYKFGTNRVEIAY